MTDAFTVQTFAPGDTVTYVVEAVGAITVLAAGLCLKNRRRSKLRQRP
jgi:hypothetical protein